MLRRYFGRLELAGGLLILALVAVAVLLVAANWSERSHERAVVERIEPCLAQLSALQDTSAAMATSWVLALTLDRADAAADYGRDRVTLERQVAELEAGRAKGPRAAAVADIAARARLLAAGGDALLAAARATPAAEQRAQDPAAAVQAFLTFETAIADVEQALRGDIDAARAESERIERASWLVAGAGLLAGALAVGLLLRLGALRRRTLWASELERHRLAAMMQATRVGVIELGADAAVRFANPAASAQLEQPPEALLGRPIGALVAPPDDGAPHPLLTAIRRAEPWSADTTLLGGSGVPVPARVRCAPLPGGGAVLIFEGLRDEQERERAREEFLVMASHEVRGPLTSVLGFARLLKRRMDAGQPLAADDTREALEVIAQQSERMQHAVSLFLDVARLEWGTLPLEVEPVSLQGLMRTELAALGQRYPHVAIDEEYAADVPIVESDEQQLRQIVGNLLDNAAKYADRTDPQIVVVLEPAAGGGARVCVRDNGPGIRPDDVPYLFQRFYRTDRPKAPGDGLGLGLYISSRIADRLQATLEVVPRPGAGAEFVLTLPLALSGVPPAGIPAPEGGG